MAFEVKYRMNFQDELGIEYETDILQEGYVGGISVIKGDTSFPLTIEMENFDDPFEPVCHTNAIITIMSETLDEWVEFQTADVFEYAIDIKRAGSTYWKGVLVTETYEEQYTTEPYGVKLTFNDGLSELQFERYDNSGILRSSMETVINILVNCISELPSFLARDFREMINILEDSMNDADTEGLLEQLVVFEGAFWEKDDDDKIKGENCLEVIKGIMSSLKCRIIVSQDKWYIQRIGEMLNTVPVKFVDYDSTGTVTGNGTLDLRQALTDRTVALPDRLVPIENDANNAFNREYQEVQFLYSSKNVITLDNNLIINWEFSKGYELENTAVVPKHWKRSTAVNTQLGVDPTGLHLAQSSILVGQLNNPITFGQPLPPINFVPVSNVLVIEDSMLLKTKIITEPLLVFPLNSDAATRETFNLLSESPADNTVTWKNLLTDTSDHMTLRIEGHFDYTFTNVNLLSNPSSVFHKWTIQLGSNFYDTFTASWSASVDNRTFFRDWADWQNDQIVNQSGATVTRRHFFNRTITMANFPVTGTNDLTIRWFIPENSRSPNSFGTAEAVSSMEVVFTQMSARYVSSNSTEFSIQKVLGETGSNTLRSRRFIANVKHGDGPSSFSIMSFRLPTSFQATAIWSSRGAAEAKPGYKILIIEPIFENLGDYRQVWSGSLQGFLELHNTVSAIDSKVFIIKGYSFNVLAGIHTLVLHEVAALSPVITFDVQFDLPIFTNPGDSGDIPIHHNENQFDGNVTTNLGMGPTNTSNQNTAFTQTIRTNNDNTETGKDYPV